MKVFLFNFLPQFQKLPWEQWRHNDIWLGKKHSVSQCSTPSTWKASYPRVRNLGLLPFPLWGVHKQSTCPLFAENLNTVEMTEKKGLLVATPLAAEIPPKWTLRYFPACAVYDSKLHKRFGRHWLRSLCSARAVCSDASLAFWSTARFPLTFPMQHYYFKLDFYFWGLFGVWCAGISLNSLFWLLLLGK